MNPPHEPHRDESRRTANVPTAKGTPGARRPFGMPPPWVQALGVLGDHLLLPGMIGYSKVGPSLQKPFWRMPATRLDGKTVVITGATAGIGLVTAHALADRGARLVLLGRDMAKLAATAEALTARGAPAPVTVRADMASLASLADALRDVRAACPHGIDILVNNAGGLYPTRSVTADGFERSFAVNLLAHVYVTESLLPLLARTGDAKVISVASGGLYTQRLDVASLKDGPARYDGPTAHAQAKRGLVVMHEIWARRHAGQGVMFLAMHPGWADTGVRDGLPVFAKITRPILRTAEEGADTLVWLALSALPRRYDGSFWFDRLPRSLYLLPGTREDDEERRRLVLLLGVCLDDVRDEA